MTILQALFLGVVQGLTEFIPVSSTAHLFIASTWLGLPPDERIFAFNVIIQLGTVAAMLLYFWKDIWRIGRAFLIGLWNRKPFEDFDARLGWLVIVATMPAALIGLILRDFVKFMAGEPLMWAGIRLLCTAALLTYVEYVDRKDRTLDTANWKDALSVGLFQILAIFPGASRSGSTIAGGMVRGFDRASAARFAFLMSAPILLAAGLYESQTIIAMEGTWDFLPYLIAGFVSAGVVGWISIRWLLAFLQRHSLYIFSAYCLIVGVTVLLIR